ncbi:hypothetical protein RSO41_13390 [Halomonas sp. I1]|uniref:hypothetical protein n=1 Tax=Halomonas sp. I1 TaxID=393536 RepID=UPI0028DDD969|nr:hypothetical protein [Halomonas sp. I1]MDT8895646.1 hypothetical protein [Halomonas sp. I1]
MSQILTSPDAGAQRRAGNTAFDLTGKTQEQVQQMMRDAAQSIAEMLNQHGIPLETGRWRPDVGPVQIDMIVIEERVTKPEPGMRLQFDTQGSMGVTLNVKLREFADDPSGYVRDLFAQLAPMRRNIMRLRRNKQDATKAIYSRLTGGAQ